MFKETLISSSVSFIFYSISLIFFINFLKEDNDDHLNAEIITYLTI